MRKIDRRQVTALTRLSTGKKVPLGAFFGVGRKTWQSLIDNGWATQDSVSSKLLITELGQKVYAKAALDGIEPLQSPEDHSWIDEEGGIYRAIFENGHESPGFPDHWQANDYRVAFGIVRENPDSSLPAFALSDEPTAILHPTDKVIRAHVALLEINKQKYQPHHRWVETSPGEKKEDFTAWDGEENFARICFDKNSRRKGGKWKWEIIQPTWLRENSFYSLNGWMPTARDAVERVEQEWHSLRNVHARL
ncbi:hypothetical protein [Rhizobium sp. C4]|uniref:hypothetical protein n=1 Tax=Rhizobium sp. C4 TaxID=1349800 RepID=UPI001E301172|nr:hypothetical protein [Rhizobium sp. C4]MCD2175347.1 hypothetical protein [Rhizobium sp. C4]